MRPYTVYIHEDLLSEVPKSGAARNQIMKFIRNLGENPDSKGDYSETDDTGRIVQIKVLGKFALTYWSDSPVREVKVTKIQRADGQSS